MNSSLIIFDWSGTISDDRHVVHKANILLSKEYNVAPIDDFSEWLKNTKTGPAEYMQSRGVTLPKEVIWNRYVTIYNDLIKAGVVPVMYEETPMVLAKLKELGKKLAIVSAHPESHVRAEATSYTILSYFDVIKASTSDKAPAIESICSKLQVSPKETAYVGDMIYDIIAAKAAGVTAIAVTHGYHSKEELEKQKPDAVWEDLTYALKNN